MNDETSKPGTQDEGLGLQFPCDYQVKAMGLDDGSFRDTVVEILANHCARIDEERIVCRGSANGKYLTTRYSPRARPGGPSTCSTRARSPWFRPIVEDRSPIMAPASWWSISCCPCARPASALEAW